jgi:hypothetical protein
MSLKFAESRPYTDPDATARKLVEIASMIEPVQDGRIYIELVNAGFMRQHAGVRRRDQICESHLGP